ncbi:MAG: hypothetical protein U0P48_12170 [Ancrocorticia sp.]
MVELIGLGVVLWVIASGLQKMAGATWFEAVLRPPFWTIGVVFQLIGFALRIVLAIVTGAAIVSLFSS